MQATKIRKSIAGQWMDRCIDCGATLICWAWFIFGYFLFFSWRYLLAVRIADDQQARFQELTNQFYRIFFKILRITAPRHKIEIDDEVAAIRSAVIVCNHLSYLDPLLMIALYRKHKTIVKARFLSLPIFGWIIKKSGYLPDAGEGRYTSMMLAQMETMPKFLASGGNLFVFPEGTRSRDGKLGALNNGAFKIARLCRAPIYVLHIANTDTLFSPGKFLFNTRMNNTIRVKVIDHIAPDVASERPSTMYLKQRVHQAFDEIPV